MSATRILVVDDEEAILRYLRIVLAAEGYRVDETAAGRTAIARCTAGVPDLVLLDLGLPDIDGLDVIRAIRTWSPVPIIVLSVRADEDDKVEALDAGANDYLQKPFGTAELLARIRSALRSRSPDTGRTVYEAGDLRVDLARHTVTRAGREIRLTPKEFSLLALLVRHAGRVLTHRQILVEVWGPGHAGDVQYLRVYIGQLRDKLGDDAASPKLIASEPGIGYRLLD